MVVYTDAGLKNELPSTTKPDTLLGQTLYVGPMVGTQGVQYTAVATPVCHFVNVENSKGGSKKGTLLLENPRGNTLNVEQLLAQVLVMISNIFNLIYSLMVNTNKNMNNLYFFKVSKLIN